MTISLPRLLAPLNSFLEPVLRTGLGNPLPLGTGIVLLNVVGRRTGISRQTPLLANDLGRCLVVSTVRGESQWLKNLAATPDASVWLRGVERPVTATVYRHGDQVSASNGEAGPIECAARNLSRLLGGGTAVLKLR